MWDYDERYIWVLFIFSAIGYVIGWYHGHRTKRIERQERENDPAHLGR